MEFMILQGLVSVHSHGYVHCDLKPVNLLVFPRHEYEKDGVGGLKSTYEPKISDFGMSTKVGEDRSFGNLIIRSWERLFTCRRNLFTTASPSKRCIALEMYTGEAPWPFKDSKERSPQLLNGNAPEIPQSLPLDARQFLQTCFARNPEERGTASELLKHRFLRIVSDQKKVMVTGAGGN